MADLNRAVKVSDEGVVAMPFGHRDRARALNILGNRLLERSYATGSSEDLRQSLLVTGKVGILRIRNRPGASN